MSSSTVCNIVTEVCEAIAEVLWKDHVEKHFPKNVDDYEESLMTFDSLWQFPFCFKAVNGCHTPIKFRTGGLEAKKEYHNFKKFDSIVLMAIVDFPYRFMWDSSGYPVNCHDAIIIQSTNLYQENTETPFIPLIGQNKNGALR